MTEQTQFLHGSDLEILEQLYGIEKESMISFSANVNPLGISPLLRKTLTENIDIISRYPERESLSLKKSIAAYTGCEPENIITGSGVTELIASCISMIKPGKALILGPTYSEYAHEVERGGGIAEYYFTRADEDFQLDITNFMEHLKKDYDLVILCNPNNPTSSLLSSREITTILEVLREQDTLLMIDETYAEFAEAESLISALPLTRFYDNLLVLRGTSKFFAAPGLRLGYCVTCNLPLLAKLNSEQRPWNVNSFAELAGIEMFHDTEYILKVKNFMAVERRHTCQLLKRIPGLTVFPSHANFVLIRIDKENITADQIFEACLQEKMVIRVCNSFPSLDERFFRICYMQPEQNEALVKCIEKALK